jgi:hypothetical protein
MAAVLDEASRLLFGPRGLLARRGLLLRVSAYEVCGAAAHDLLSGRAKLRIREDKAGRIVLDAAARGAGDAGALRALLVEASRARRTAATARNPGSSRCGNGVGWWVEANHTWGFFVCLDAAHSRLPGLPALTQSQIYCNRRAVTHTIISRYILPTALAGATRSTTCSSCQSQPHLAPRAAAAAAIVKAAAAAEAAAAAGGVAACCWSTWLAARGLLTQQITTWSGSCRAPRSTAASRHSRWARRQCGDAARSWGVGANVCGSFHKWHQGSARSVVVQSTR